MLLYKLNVKMLNWQRRQCGRVVKALASKANGFSRAGSNPAIVVLFCSALCFKLLII